MREFWKMASFKSKIAVLLSEVAIIAAVVGMFVLKTEMRVICWACLICVWAINYLVVFEDTVRLRKENYLKDYEIVELRYSYRRMGTYIDSFNIEQLEDIELRIENELRDIECKVNYRKEREKGL
jgi:hypothetical protein